MHTESGEEERKRERVEDSFVPPMLGKGREGGEEKKGRKKGVGRGRKAVIRSSQGKKMEEEEV